MIFISCIIDYDCVSRVYWVVAASHVSGFLWNNKAPPQCSKWWIWRQPPCRYETFNLFTTSFNTPDCHSNSKESWFSSRVNLFGFWVAEYMNDSFYEAVDFPLPASWASFLLSKLLLMAFALCSCVQKASIRLNAEMSLSFFCWADRKNHVLINCQRDSRFGSCFRLENWSESYSSKNKFFTWWFGLLLPRVLVRH